MVSLYAFDGSDAKPMGSRSTNTAVLATIIFDSAVQISKLLQAVLVIRWSFFISSKPCKLRWVEDGRNDQLILGLRVELILGIDSLLKWILS